MVVAMALMAVAPDVFAQAQKAGDVADNLSGQVPAFAEAIKLFMYLGGFGLVGWGFVKWLGKEKYNHKGGEIALPIVIGALLLSLITVSDIMSRSTVDQQATGLEDLEVR
jgi:hypothetical protein